MKILGIGRAICEICGYSWWGVMPERCICSQCSADMTIEPELDQEKPV